MAVWSGLAAGACGSDSAHKSVMTDGGEGGLAAGGIAGVGPMVDGGAGHSSGLGGAPAGADAGGAPAINGGSAAGGESGGAAGAATACEDGALEFSGAQFVDVVNTAQLHLKTEMTLEAWVKTSTDVAVESIFLSKHRCGTDNGYFLEIYSTSLDGAHVPNAPAFYVAANNQHAYGTASIVDGKWHHVAGSWDGTTSKLYVDGAFVSSKTAAYVNTNTTDLMLGAATDGSCRPFSGRLDEVSVWSVARTAQQIANDAVQPISKDAPGLEAYFDFDSSGCGQTLTDRSPHGRDGVLGSSPETLVGDPTWVSDGPFSL